VRSVPLLFSVQHDPIDRLFERNNFLEDIVGSATGNANQIGATAAPALFTLGEFKVRKSALFYGAALTLILYCGLFLALKHSRKHYVYLPSALSESVASPENQPLDSYAGVYSSDLPNKLTVTITARSGHLMVEMSSEWKSILVPVPGKRFVFSDGQENWIEFSKHDNGVTYGIRVHRNGSEFQAHRVIN